MKKHKHKQNILLELIFFSVVLAASMFLVVWIENNSLFAAQLKDLSAKKSPMVSRGELVDFIAGVKAYPPPKKKKKCFSDYAISICAAKEKGLLKGLFEKKIKARAPIRFNELLVLTCRAEGWLKPSARGIDKEYLACLKAAKTKQLLKPFGEKSPSKKQLVKRKLVVKFLKKALTTTEAAREAAAEIAEPKEEETNDQDETPSSESRSSATEETPVMPFTPVASNLISKSFFETVELTKDFSNTYYTGEFFLLEGEVLSGDFDEIFAFLLPDQPLPGVDTINYTVEVKNRKFKIPVIFRRPGNYKFGIIPGQSGKSKVADISVIESLPPPSGARTAPIIKKELQWEYKDGETKFSWQNREGNLVKLTFRQGTQEIAYFFRSFLSEFKPDPIDFKKFKKGAVEVAAEFAYGDSFPLTINSAWISSSSLSLTLDMQSFWKVEESMTIKQFSEHLAQPGNFVFEGKAKVTLSNEGAYTLPNGEVKTFPLLQDATKKSLPPGVEFTVGLTFDTPGIYIFEINDPEGGAVVNAPVAVGVTPLLPDFFAQNAAVLDPASLKNVAEAREEILTMINEARKRVGAQSVKADESALRALAQAHSDDMVKRDFFAHANPDGKGPQERAVLYKVDTLVRENLAKGPNLAFAFEGLMRSPVHRKNIQEAKWTRVGIGVTKNNEGYYHVTQEFSKDSLTEEDLIRLEDELITKANELRDARGIRHLEKHDLLMAQAKEWSRKMAAQKFFGFKGTDGQGLLENVRNAGLRSAVQSHLVESQETEKVEAEFREQPPIEDSRFRTLGIGIAKDETGVLKVTVIYNE